MYKFVQLKAYYRISKAWCTRELAAELTGDRDGSLANSSCVHSFLRVVFASRGNEENNSFFYFLPRAEKPLRVRRT